MKYIVKKQPPEEFIAWLHERTEDGEKATNWTYADISAELRQIIKAALVREQGGLCCYTGRRIAHNSSHIEHLKPQQICQNHEDTEYANIVAAYPAWNAPRQCPYGAHAKKNWYDIHLFVHPLRNDCEVRFRYRMNGKINPSNPNDEGAAKTIDRLNLKHEELRQMREAAIHEALFEKKLSGSLVK